MHRKKVDLSCSCPDIFLSNVCYESARVESKKIKSHWFKVHVRSLLVAHQQLKRGSTQVRCKLNKLLNRWLNNEKNQIKVEPLGQDLINSQDFVANKSSNASLTAEISFDTLQVRDVEFNFIKQNQCIIQEHELMTIDFSQLDEMVESKKWLVYIFLEGNMLMIVFL